MTRRECIAGLLASRASKLRYAICSGAFAGQTLPEMCRSAKRTGFTGLELDPTQLSANPALLTPAQRREWRDVFVGEDVPYVGVHGFLRLPEGLHITTPDEAVRKRSWEHFDRIIDLAADIGRNPTIVLGHGKQRQAIDGVSPADAANIVADGLARLAPHAQSRGVVIVMEPLAPHLCNVINTLDEAMAIVKYANSPAVQTIFDTHNTAAEKESMDRLIRRHFANIRHVHLNEMDGRYPGSGNFPFPVVLRELSALNYTGWVSVELFDFKPDGETVASRSAEYLRGIDSSSRR